jgi:hypothetical protein
VNIEILNMKKFEPNDKAINIALPVLAVECEATPPIKNYLDEIGFSRHQGTIGSAFDADTSIRYESLLTGNPDSSLL